MSKAIANLLNKPEHLVSGVIKKLEDINNNPSEDVRLLSENIQKLRSKLQQLGLDPNDTTSEELYHALRVRFTADSYQLDSALKVATEANLAARIAKATQLVAGLGAMPDMWLIKHTAAKKLLRQMPPKKLMKKLNYRSVESLLKRENIDNIFLAAGRTELESWYTGLAKKISKLSSTDFEMRALHVATLPESYWQDTAGPESYVSAEHKLGSLALWPRHRSDEVQVLTLAVALINGLEELSGVEFTSKFYQTSPSLRWWADNSHLISGQAARPVSLNLKDISRDFLDSNDYHHRTTEHGARALFTTLLSRYQNQSDKLADKLKDIGYDLSSELNNSPEVPFDAQVVAEYAGAE